MANVKVVEKKTDWGSRGILWCSVFSEDQRCSERQINTTIDIYDNIGANLIELPASDDHIVRFNDSGTWEHDELKSASGPHREKNILRLRR